MTIMRSGAPKMGKFLAQWFIYTVVVAFIVAYLTSRTVATGAEYLAVFRVAGTTAFIAYAMAHVSNSIWKGQPWSLAFKHVMDGFIYGLLVAGAFAWLWPEVI